MSEPEMIDWNEISRRGLLERINREIMHPLGLAVARHVDTGASPGALVAPDGQQWAYAHAYSVKEVADESVPAADVIGVTDADKAWANMHDPVTLEPKP